MKRLIAIQKSSRTSTSALEVCSVALSKRFDQLAVVLAAVHVQPLLELVQHDQDLPVARRPPLAEHSECIVQ